MPGDSIFVDTDVLLYAFDSQNPVKRAQAEHWLDYLWPTREGRMSWQVLNELYANAVRRPGVPASAARKVVSEFTVWQPAGIDLGLIERAWHWMDRAQLSYWDSLIIGSAERLGCNISLSEDFQVNRRYGGVRTVNPFQSMPEDLSSRDR